MAKVDANFFKPFIDETKKTLKIQCGIDGTHGKIFIKGTQIALFIEIAGIIGITERNAKPRWAENF